MSSSRQNDLQSGENNSKPPPEMLDLLEKTAIWVSQRGLEFEGWIVNSVKRTENEKLMFLLSSDPYHSLYLEKLAEYRTQSMPDASDDIQDDGDDSEGHYLLAQERYTRPWTSLIFGVPEGMMRKELDIMKLTACFSARYGKHFWMELKKRVDTNPEFEFMKDNDSRRIFLTGLSMAYLDIIPDECILGRFLRNRAAELDPVQEDFSRRLGCLDEEWEKEKDETAEMVVVDWMHFFGGSKEFAFREEAVLQPPEMPAGERLPLPQASDYANPRFSSPRFWMMPAPPEKKASPSLPVLTRHRSPDKASLSLTEEPEPKKPKFDDQA